MRQVVGDPDAAFAAADLTFHFDFRFGRVSGQPMEARGAVAVAQRSEAGPEPDALVIDSDAPQCPTDSEHVFSIFLEQSIHVIAPMSVVGSV